MSRPSSPPTPDGSPPVVDSACASEPGSTPWLRRPVAEPPRHPREAGVDRGGVTVVAVVLLVAVTVVASAVVGGAVLSVAPADPAPQVALSLTVEGDEVRFTHRGGERLDVRNLSVRVTVNGTPLDHQPPVPFFAARGFAPGPTGPFNSATDPTWEAGETASFALAGTNQPQVTPGAAVRVRVTSQADGGNWTVATLESRASGASA